MARTKTGAQRFEDSLEYISTYVDQGLAQDIRQILVSAAEDVERNLESEIGDDLSLSGTYAKLYAWTKNKRHAIRALLLCQRVYFSKLWARLNNMDGTSSAYDLRPEGMTKTSITYWKGKTELEIRQGIELFVTKPEAGGPALVQAAGDQGDVDLGHPVLTLTRQTRPFIGSTICYSAVMHWLFRAGLVSYRWIMRHNSTPPVGLRQVFGNGTIVISSNDQFTEASHLPNVPAGHIAHIYTPARFGGHWLVCDGMGGAYGCNNNDEPGKERVYDLCTLKGQFLDEKYEHADAILEIHNPLQIPNRL